MIWIWISALYTLNTICLLVIAIREVRHSPNAVMWLTINMLLPFVGFAVYLIITQTLRKKRRAAIRLKSDEPMKTVSLPSGFGHSASIIVAALRQLSVGELRKGRVQVLTNGLQTYDELIAALQKANKTIDIAYYIYRDDQIGTYITDLIIAKAREGVRVRFIKDGLGSRQFPNSEIALMQAAGVACRTTHPFRFPWITPTLNYRNHCKIVVIDGNEVFTGGINVGDEYTGLKPGVGFWRDTDVRIIGEAAEDYQIVFDSHWEMSTPEKQRKVKYDKIEQRLERRKPLQPRQRKKLLIEMMAEWSVELGNELDDWLGGKTGEQKKNDRFTKGTITDDAVNDQTVMRDSATNDKVMNESATNDTVMVEACIHNIEGNPALSTQVIRNAMFISLTQASRSIDLTTPYFLPNEDFLMALKTAVARGVRVRLIVPQQVDHKIVDLASRTYLGELEEAGVEIYLYTRGILHPKILIIDEEVSDIGAANIDERSFRLNYEMNSVFYSREIAQQLTAQFERDISDSIRLEHNVLTERSLPTRIVEQAARIFAPLL